jgi:hypothetical protein
MARNTSVRRARNTAPLWKKITLIVAAVAAPAVVVRFTSANTWNLFLFAAVVIGCAALAVWLAAKIVGVRLSLGSWDDAPRGGPR